MSKNTKRLKILSASEYEFLYARPVFDEYERQHYFGSPGISVFPSSCLNPLLVAECSVT